MDSYFWLLMLRDLGEALCIIAAGWFAIRSLIRYHRRLNLSAAPAAPPPQEENHRAITSLRLQACERLILFLERIRPESLLMRTGNTGLTAPLFQALLLRTIREEFEYNLSQQLYISGKAWDMIKLAKEEVIGMINSAASGLQEGDPPQELIRRIIGLSASQGESPVNNAIGQLKKELF